MSCQAKNCKLGADLAVEPCANCTRAVHHICSNKYMEGELNVRVCSKHCADVINPPASTNKGSVMARETVLVTNTESSDMSSSSEVDDTQDLVSSSATTMSSDELPSTDTYNLQRLLAVCRRTVPAEVRYFKYTAGRHKMWEVVYVLEKKIHHGKSIGSHLCLLCVEQVSKRGHKRDSAWKRAVCSGSNGSNVLLHLRRRHSAHPAAVAALSSATDRAAAAISRSHDELSKHIHKRHGDVDDKDESTAKQLDTDGETSRPLKKRQKKIDRYFRPSGSLIRTVIAEWLTDDGLAYNTVTTTAFQNMIRVVSGNTQQKILARDTYNDSTEGRFKLFTTAVSTLLDEESHHLGGMKFLTLIHDAWTCNKSTGVIGASVAFIDHTWRFRHIALLASVKNDGHTSRDVSLLIENRCIEHYGINIRDFARWTMSDTTASARAVANYFEETDQEDCRMHLLNLCIGYGIGLKDNVKTTKSTRQDDDGTVIIGERKVVTTGGALPEGVAIVRKLRALNNFFSTPKRTSKLVKIQEAHNLPRIAPLVDVDVRVASTCRLMRRSIVNYTAMKYYFMEEDTSNPFIDISDSEWTLVREMEGITQHLAELALSHVQSSTLVASYMVLYRTMAEQQLKCKSFRCLVMRPSLSGPTTEDQHEREDVSIESLSKPARTCLARCLGQIRERFPTPSIHEAVALLLDPRTKNCASAIIDGTGCPNLHREKLLKQAEDLIIAEHMRLRGKELNEETPLTTISSPTQSKQKRILEPPTASTVSPTVFFGAPVPSRTKVGFQESELRGEAIADFKRWMVFQEEWLNVALSQDPKADRAVLSKTMCFKRGDDMLCWNLPELSRVDILRWFREVGEPQFPMISTLARVWLGKVSSTAYQERVFSTAGIVMAPSRSRTDNDRAEKQLLLRVNRQEVESSTASLLQ